MSYTTSELESSAFHTDVEGPPPILPQAGASQPALTPKRLKQMIVSAFFALSLQGKGQVLSSPWFVVSGVSNHMTSDFASSCNIRLYSSTHHIQIANASILSITAVGDIGPLIMFLYLWAYH